MEEALRRVRFPLWSVYDYTVHFKLNNEIFGMYVKAEHEDDAKKQVRAMYKDSDIEIIRVIRGIEESNK